MKKCCSILACLACIAWAAGAEDSRAVQRETWPVNGWPAAAPEEVGLSAEGLARIEPYIRERMPRTTSILVIRGGAIAYEKYYTGTAETLRIVLSATKSVVSLLVGIAIDRGEMPGPATRLIDAVGWLDRTLVRKEAGEIELRHLLTMTSGISRHGFCDRAVGDRGGARYPAAKQAG